MIGRRSLLAASASAVVLAAALALWAGTGADAQMAYNHGKIMSCYYSSWAYYR